MDAVTDAETMVGPDSDELAMTVDIVAAFVSNNRVPLSELPALIAAVHGTLRSLSAPRAEPAEAPRPAVPIRRSIHPDFLVCLEDGKRFKSLKRHLRTQYGLTPEAYREKWRLAPDYPMVAPNYAAARSTLARSMGLGQRQRKAAE